MKPLALLHQNLTPFRLFNHVNYEDPDINVAIPVFSIHGNHDEPTGHEFYCALDVLQMTGLVNYFGRVPKSDSIEVRPVLLQKGRTKLALYGLSNVRDERLFRVFRDKNVKFYQPHSSSGDWFNLMTVHQNHAARTVTGYLPESFLPDFMDLVIWGHEHECLIDPVHSSDGNFYVSQPGSSIVTQLQKGEMGPKHVGLLTLTGREFKMEPIRLKTPRPFVMRDIVLAEEQALKNVWKKTNNRAEITRHLKRVMEEMIEQANQEWLDLQEDNGDIDQNEAPEIPLPILRLRVDYTAPEGGSFDLENSRRIANEFNERIANHEEVITFHQKKKTATAIRQSAIDLPDASVIEAITLDAVKVDELVREFLTAQSLAVLPQNAFGDSVNQFVDKDDRHALELFVNESLAGQVKHLLGEEDIERTDVTEAMDSYREEREKLFAAGQARTWQKSRKLKPKPDGYDSDLDGPWEEQTAAIIFDENDDGSVAHNNGDVAMADTSPPGRTSSGRGRARGRAGRTATTSTRKTATSSKSTATAKAGRGKKKVISDDEDEEESDINMKLINDDEDEESDSQANLFVSSRGNTTTAGASKPASKSTTSRTTASRTAAAASKASVSAVKRQTKLDFSQPAPVASSRPSRSLASKSKPIVIDSDDDDIEDSSDDAFEDAPQVQPGTSRRGARR
jgi:double-strand break repair protein MRE11